MRMNVQGVKANGTLGPNPLRQLLELGHSVWLDYIRQSLISSGGLQRLIHDDGPRGITSNPAIFEQTIAGSREYADLIGDLHARRLDAVAIYESLAIREIQQAADLLRPVYDSSEYREGYVSFEDLAHFSGQVADSGEGRRILEAAIEAGTPVPVLSAALCQRFASRRADDFASKVLSAMRFEFGGHAEHGPVA
jgi:hypothetical protein